MYTVRTIEMTRDDVIVDIPDGMDPIDAKVAIKLLYDADQTYRSVLRDFANYERTKIRVEVREKEKGDASKDGETNNHNSTASSSRKRLRRSADISDNFSDRRNGRITHLHVSGIASMFLPSWDLSFTDIVKLDYLTCLKLNGCDSVPSELFFELPNLTSLCLINCQEITEPNTISAFSTSHHSCKKSSSIQKLDIRGGGLWSFDFLSTLALLLPYMSSTLVSLRLTHTPYASCYGSKSTDSLTVDTTSSENETNSALEQQQKQNKVQQENVQEQMGSLLLDGLRSLAMGTATEFMNDMVSPSLLEQLSLSFFDSIRDEDVVTLLLDVMPLFSHLTTLNLPHHKISHLKAASERINAKQRNYQLHPETSLLSPSAFVMRSSCLSWSKESSTNAPTTTSIASISRLRKLFLRPTLKYKSDNDHEISMSGRIGSSSSSSSSSNSEVHSKTSNQKEKEILISLLNYFPELSCVTQSSNHKGYLYSPCPCCNNGNELQFATKENASNKTIEYLLQMNHVGRNLLEGLDENEDENETHRRRGHEDDSRLRQNQNNSYSSRMRQRRRQHRRPCALSVWPLVLERAWKSPPPDFCFSASSATAIFHLLREGPILSNRGPIYHTP